MKLSVIIPTYDREKTLANTLAALARQSLPQGEFEVLVVDDGSREEIRRSIRVLAASERVRLIEKEQGGLASARNRGAVEAQGEFLLFLDDDVVPAPDALEQHLLSHGTAREPVAVVGSLPFPHVRLDSFLSYIERSGHYDLYRHPRKYSGGAPPMPPMNGNSSISLALFRRVGCYDESFRQYGSEDLELGYRLARAGVHFVYNPRAVGYHDHTKDFARFCVDMERAGESLIQLYRKYPEIKAAKKIDLLVDRYADLPAQKKLVKAVMSLTLRYPWVLGAPRAVLRRAEPFYALRYPAFPLYRWVAHYHYALGMRRALTSPPETTRRT